MNWKDLVELAWSDLVWSDGLERSDRETRIILLITIKYRNCYTFIQLTTSQQTMQIFNISVPDKPLTNIELVRYARLLKIPDFRGVLFRNTLPLHPFSVECDIVNFNTSNQPDCHWVCYYCNKTDRIYFDSYGQITSVEIQRYLKTGSEFDCGKEMIQRNTDIVQAASTPMCGHLCVFVLKSLTSGSEFQSILNHMQHYGYPQGDWKDYV